jgi:hypothetical protein
MIKLVLDPRLFGFVVATRAALAFGAGLLLANRIPEARRRAIGLTLVAIGAATTVPAALSVFSSRASTMESRSDLSPWV